MQIRLAPSETITKVHVPQSIRGTFITSSLSVGRSFTGPYQCTPQSCPGLSPLPTKRLALASSSSAIAHVPPLSSPEDPPAPALYSRYHFPLSVAPSSQLPYTRPQPQIRRTCLNTTWNWTPIPFHVLSLHHRNSSLIVE